MRALPEYLYRKPFPRATSPAFFLYLFIILILSIILKVFTLYTMQQEYLEAESQILSHHFREVEH